MNKSSYHIYSGRVIYTYSLPDDDHKGYVKITDRLLTLTERDMKALEEKPETLGGFVDLPEGVKIEKAWNGTFTDAASGKRYLVNARDIYDYLENSGVNFKYFNKDKTTQEETDKWFEASSEDVEKVITQIRQNLTDVNAVEGIRKIHFRPEQKKAIEETTKYLKNGGKRYLWNAKMRFGKTLSALEVARRMGYKFTLIVTHRPVVNDGWKKDFDIIFKDSGYEYGAIVDKNAKDSGYFENLINNVESGKSNGLVFFVSIQYLRLSHLVKPSEAKKKTNKKNEEKTAILNFPWDFVVIDEAHEGTQSERGVEVMRYLRLNVPDNEEKQPVLSNSIDAISRKKEEETQSAAEDKKKREEEKLPVSSRCWKTMHSDEDPITLSLSGTPFNLYTEFSPKEIYTWDYVKEQTAKENWSRLHHDDPNPYDVLPRMHIFNLDIEETIGRPILEPGDSESKGNSEKNITDEELDEEFSGFNFSRLFKVWDKNLCKKHGKETDLEGKFVHEDELMEFFYALARETEEGSHFPFSTSEFRKAFRHTFWLIPGVSEGKALQKLLEKPQWTIRGATVVNPYKKNFRVINVAGSEQEDLTGEALRDVKDHITLTKGKMPKGPWDEKPLHRLSKKDLKRYENYKKQLSDWKGKCTITLSCGKLTTGVSVPEWTAVFYMKGNDATSASSYMQTIFRTQTPAVVNGMQKTDCYVFDFSPTRSLKVFSDAVRLYMASERGNDRTERYTRDEQKVEMKKWLDLMPLQAINVVKPGDEKTSMEEYDADKLFSQLDEKLINRVVRSGYADNSIYDSVAIMEISDDAATRLKEISKRVKGDKTSTVDAGTIQTGPNTPGKPSGKQRRLAQGAAGKSDKDLAQEEIEAKKAVDAYNRQRRERMKTMRAISIRIPLLMYGAEISNEDELKIENFTKLVDDESWAEFMPKYLTKEDFDMVRDCYDPVRFRGAAEKIREYAEKADTLSKTERVKEIARIFSFFHNPDKETVLTPWRVVNMHMSQTLGGYNFFDDEFKKPREEEPEFVGQGNVTFDTLATQGDDDPYKREEEIDQRRILEINSKTGLYPLYIAYSIFQDRKNICKAIKLNNPDYEIKEDEVLWKETLKKNLFVVCKTPMAKAITKRTLAGFNKDYQVNVVSPTWKISERDLVKAGVKKLDKGEEVDDSKVCEVDIVDLLRVEDYEMNSYLKKIEAKKNKGGNPNKNLKEPESYFKKDITSKNWWQHNLPFNKFDNIKKDMINFNAVIGNPPYQINDGGGAAADTAMPIYHKFVKASQKVNPSYISFIMPSKWMVGGRGLSEFRSDFSQDPHLKKLFDYEDDSYIFNGINIDGGVCYFLWDKFYQGYPEIHYHSETGELSISNHSLQNDFFDYIIRNQKIIPILEKTSKFSSFSQIVSNVRPFGIRGYLFNEPERYPDSNLQDEEFENSIKVYGVRGIKGGAKRVEGYISRDFINIGKDWIDKYKILFTTSYSTGATIPPLHIDALPKEICTETFLVIGPFSSKEEMKACSKYIQTNFFRFLLYWGKGTMHVTSSVFALIPNQDFTSANKDIDWSKSVAEIDQRLYKKYGLEKPEIDFIESMIKPME